MKLYAFPYAGGSASVFVRWQKHMASFIELVPVELQGHGALMNRPCFTRMDDLVDELYVRLFSETPAEPFAFFGHSMGSLIALELSRRLSKAGQCRPEHLFLSGMLPPHLRVTEPGTTANMTTLQLKRKVADLGGVSDEVLENDEFFTLFEPILRADFEICEYYEAPVIENNNSAFTVFVGTDDPATDQRVEQWALYGNDLNVYYYEGGHFFIHTHWVDMIKRIHVALAASRKQ
ncbi:thioesterase II family protein [Paenibacillus campi]|uniref:thioesterase II family protein n=1 Tax=Paenibacillus campi TaxID=3106031 RepID=UPI002AFE5F13|nr:alpha/beta fold hydrolase [Paenibacillus sp. SGZ-1014]